MDLLGYLPIGFLFLLIASFVYIIKLTNSIASRINGTNLMHETIVILLYALVHCEHPSPTVISSLDQLHHQHHTVQQPIFIRVFCLKLCIIGEHKTSNAIINGQHLLPSLINSSIFGGIITKYAINTINFINNINAINH